MLFLLIGSLTQMAIAVWTFFADTAEMPRAEIKEGALVLTISLNMLFWRTQFTRKTT
ncbi:TPA: hypothetical protein ACJT8G_003041 [Legionella pneumophila]